MSNQILTKLKWYYGIDIHKVLLFVVLFIHIKFILWNQECNGKNIVNRIWFDKIFHNTLILISDEIHLFWNFWWWSCSQGNYGYNEWLFVSMILIMAFALKQQISSLNLNRWVIKASPCGLWEIILKVRILQQILTIET